MDDLHSRLNYYPWTIKQVLQLSCLSLLLLLCVRLNYYPWTIKQVLQLSCLSLLPLLCVRLNYYPWTIKQFLQLSCLSHLPQLCVRNFLIIFEGPTVVNRACPTFNNGLFEIIATSPFNKVFLDYVDRRRRHSLHLVQGEKNPPKMFFINSQNTWINLFSTYGILTGK